MSGFQWFMGLYTNGDDADSRGYLSIYLFLDVDALPKRRSVHLNYRLSIPNLRNPSQSLSKEYKATFPIKGGQGWGDRRAIAASAVTKASGFLDPSAALTVVAEVLHARSQWHV
eukprot:TRINITY_DN1375_c0_g4_i1.p1 TRINITY_DN1375_c0_g4~~TRINITY_DN1375_c0_g4_i1.p1  ORF type:complete len:114 (-),score=33.80 TRINITY_DN1375_c0_g4_i1:64-405(-)